MKLPASFLSSSNSNQKIVLDLSRYGVFNGVLSKMLIVFVLFFKNLLSGKMSSGMLLIETYL